MLNVTLQANILRYPNLDKHALGLIFQETCIKPKFLHSLSGSLLSGVPATVSVGGADDNHTPKALHVAEAVQAYITVMDSLRLNMCAVDQVQFLSCHT